MTTVEPSGEAVYSPKIANQSLVRKFVAQNGQGYVAISIQQGTQNVDPDPNTIGLQVYFMDPTVAPTTSDPRGTLVITATSSQITRTGVGTFYYDIGPQFTKYRGVLTAVWTYAVGGTTFTYLDYLQVLNQMPTYEGLSPAEKVIVEQVSWMYGDLFDSTEGGPYLIEPFQTHFDYERIAQMLILALNWFNVTAFPFTSFSAGIDPVTGYQANPVPQNFNGLLVLGTYLEVMRHLRDSYVEIPAFAQMNVTYADRRDYSQRWGQIFDDTWPQYIKAVTLAKRSLLNLARGSLLVGGGIYGGNALGIFQAGTYAAQVRSWRFYPAAPAISWGATAH